MMDPLFILALIIAFIVPYLIGSIPFGYILVKLFGKKDVRNVGSGGTGATNVVRAGGKWLGLITLLLDAGKGFIVVIPAFYAAVGVSFGGNDFLTQLIFTLPHLGVILGHMFPVWLDFKGGKSFATFLGISIAYSMLMPPLIFVIAAFWIGTFLITRISAAGAIASIIAANAYLILGGEDIIIAYILISLLVIAKHHENIRRMLNGTENKFTFGSQK